MPYEKSTIPHTKMPPCAVPAIVRCVISSYEFRYCARLTRVLFRTRRRDECARLQEGVRRRVRKSRQKEAAGAADAGLMQIEWSERGCQYERVFGHVLTFLSLRPCHLCGRDIPALPSASTFRNVRGGRLSVAEESCLPLRRSVRPRPECRVLGFFLQRSRSGIATGKVLFKMSCSPLWVYTVNAV